MKAAAIFAGTALSALVILAGARAAEDARELVVLPQPMQAHMLSNMRDHLLALGEVFRLLAEDKIDEARKTAETRIGMSSLELHGASHMAPYMPPGMRAIGTEMHKAASRFAAAAQTAQIEHSYEAQQKVFAALAAVTEACNACHTAYRIR
jgi:hypothetical protein